MNEMPVRLMQTLVVLTLTIFLVGCSQSRYPSEVAKTLKAAGDNRVELEKVLAHYSAPEDSLKLQAAFFLIGNMEGHCYATYALRDTADADIDFDVLDYVNFEALLVAADSIEKERGEMDFQRGDKTLDVETITSDFLIEQIDYAFRAWREKPWAQGFSFYEFCQYILPYRGSNEPLESWRRPFWKRYIDIADSMTNPSDPIEAATLINDDIMSWFGFDPRFYYHPTDQGLSEMLANGVGRCEDMTNITIYAMRANGLAVTSDYTPHWANSGNNHAWNAIITPDSDVIPFMGAEANPGHYGLANKLAKVYRKSFGQKKDNLVFLKRKQEKIPPWLGGKSYIDVTAHYVDVCDVTVALTAEIPDSVDIAYLCVFNSGEWKAIHWGHIESSTATFTDMGKEIAYLPAFYINEEISPAGPPFILHDDCSLTELEPDTVEHTTVMLTSTTRRKQEISTDGVAKTFFTDGQEYELSYWDNGWQSVGTAQAGNKPLKFDNVPAVSLYWLVAKDSDKEERIFTFEKDLQVWW
jgi:hypothetical protein